MAASGHPNSQNLELADWQLLGKRYGRNGHEAEVARNRSVFGPLIQIRMAA